MQTGDIVSSSINNRHHFTANYNDRSPPVILTTICGESQIQTHKH